jgi:hypothetical protein
MREFALSFAVFSQIPTVTEAESWWQKANKHGVGFVFFLMFLALTWLSYRRERKVEIERVKRETEVNAERISLQTEIRDLNRQQLEQAQSQSKRLEDLIREGNKAQTNVAIEMRTLARKVNCPKQNE